MAGLRTENAWFIDDNISNLEEVKFYNPGITAIHPDYLAENDILRMDIFRGKDDKRHGRLKQYQILEKRLSNKQIFSSNEEFLRSSHIAISIHYHPLMEIERVLELVQRTNQMNYTKNRMDREQLRQLLSDKNIQSAYIKAKDDFGYYGIIGFYAMRDGKLVHFLFSCRTLGFGIENYIYQKLQCPEIQVRGETAVALCRDKVPDWIAECDDAGQPVEKRHAERIRILMIGGCDLKLAARYLENRFEVREEFNTAVHGIDIRTSDTTQLLNAKHLDEQTKRQLCKELPFFDESVTFQTKLFQGRYQIVILSVADDYIRGIYQNKKDGYFIGYGAYWNQKEGLSGFAQSELQFLNGNFLFAGKETPHMFQENIRQIITNLPDDTRIMFINGAELQDAAPEMKHLNQRNHEMNKALDEVLRDFPNAVLIDMRQIVRDDGDLLNHELRHFTNKIYYQIASEIVRGCGRERAGIQLKNYKHVAAKEFCVRIKNGISRRLSGFFRKFN